MRVRTELIAGMMIAALASGPRLGAQFVATHNLSTIVVSSPDIACSTSLGTGSFGASSMSWGETLPPTSVSGGTGRISLSDFQINKSFDNCSGPLAKAMASGTHLGTITIKESDLHGNVLTTITLSQSVVSNYQLSGDSTAASPVESVSFDVTKIQIANPQGLTFCWDNAALKLC